MLAIFIPLILAFFVPIMPGSESAPAARSPPAGRGQSPGPSGAGAATRAAAGSNLKPVVCPVLSRHGPARRVTQQ
jgi:hypothetical protein